MFTSGFHIRGIPPRTLERQACELPCAIEANNATPERKAVLRNLSQTGARLEGAELEGCPEIFALRIVHTTGAVETVNARCIWRAPGVMGVKFETAATARRREVWPALSRAS